MSMKKFFDSLTPTQRDTLLDAAGTPRLHRALIHTAAAAMTAGLAVATVLTNLTASATSRVVSLLLWPVFNGARKRLTQDPAAMARFTKALREARAGAGVDPELSVEAADAIRRAMGDRRGPTSTLH